MHFNDKVRFSRALHGMMIACLVLSLLACKKIAIPEITPAEPVLPTQSYTIESGQHYCNDNFFSVFSGTSLRFIATFDSSAIYTTAIAANQRDVNKLYGFADCGSFHQENSARFGWNWRDKALHIYAYVYRNQTRLIKEITTVNLMQTNIYEITKQGDNYVFTVNGENQTLVKAGCSGSPTGYRLYPYFGGDEPAPHKITVQITDLP